MKPTVVSYGTAMQALAASGRHVEAFELLENMKRVRVIGCPCVRVLGWVGVGAWLVDAGIEGSHKHQSSIRLPHNQNHGRRAWSPTRWCTRRWRRPAAWRAASTSSWGSSGTGESAIFFLGFDFVCRVDDLWAGRRRSRMWLCACTHVGQTDRRRYDAPLTHTCAHMNRLTKT